ncbi:MAG: hypothetical protein OEZ13_13340 [Spirochaetia bacterium]|nr:hypothetical protein [Spirochaetia bacterium]
MNINTLQVIMKIKDLNLSDISKLAGISRQAVSLWFKNGKSNNNINIQSNHLQNLATRLGIRFGKNFELKTNNITEDEKIPPLIFHTLLENAFLYQELNENDTTILSKKETENSVEFLFVTSGKLLKTDSTNAVKTGVGGKYIKTVLENAYAGKWQFDSTKTEGGWKSVIRIFSS